MNIDDDDMDDGEALDYDAGYEHDDYCDDHYDDHYVMDYDDDDNNEQYYPYYDRWEYRDHRKLTNIKECLWKILIFPLIL